jgi:hypothetical protein
MINLDMGPHDGQETRILVDKPPVKRPLGKPKLRWKDKIKMDL